MEVLLLMVDLVAMFLMVRWSARSDSKSRAATPPAGPNAIQHRKR